MKAYVAVFASVLLAELGDKTQLATLIFATNPGVSSVGVFFAAAVALVVSTGLAVIAGAQLGDWLPPKQLRLLAGVGFLGIGAWMILFR
jgi:putative Ca2+/H+ antiporter (TMEM165/GDT1 family)